MKKFAPVTFLALAALMLAACTPAEGSTGRGFAYIWYVALDGSDSNNCSDPATACATLEGVLEKARDENTRLEGEYDDITGIHHTINIAAGTYMWSGLRAGYALGFVNINATIVGASEDTTIIDAADTYGGLVVSGDVEAIIRNLTIRNVNSTTPDSCLTVRGASNATVEHVTLTRCLKAGVNQTGSGLLTLRDVTSTENIATSSGYGSGAILGGPSVVEDSLFANNGGMGIISYGEGVSISNSSIVESYLDGLLVNGGDITITDVALENNGRDGSFRAGLVVSNGASATMQGGSISANQIGAWVQDSGTTALFDNTVVSGNPRTGIIVDAGTELTIQNSLVSDNASFYAGTSLGGGLSNEGHTMIRESEFSENHNGAIQNLQESGDLSLIDSNVTNNEGGLPAVYNGPTSTMVIERTLIAYNTINTTVTSDGALENRGDMTVLNTTVSSNNKIGIAASSGALSISYTTIAENGGTGLNAFTGGSVVSNVANTIIAKNVVRDCEISTGPSGSPLPTTGVNMETDGTCGFASVYSPAEILLDALADNGGPTMTHALNSGSPAIEAASGDCPGEDQRGSSRPFGPSCDVGAYEAGAAALSLEGGDVELATVTPTPGLGILIVIPDKNYNCREGNSTLFEIADTLKQGGEFTPIGIGQDKLWFQFAGPTYGQKCWAPTQGFILYLDGAQIALDGLPEGLLQVVNYPAAPTATPDIDESYDTTPTATATCYYNQQQQYICP